MVGLFFWIVCCWLFVRVVCLGLYDYLLAYACGFVRPGWLFGFAVLFTYSLVLWVLRVCGIWLDRFAYFLYLVLW